MLLDSYSLNGLGYIVPVGDTKYQFVVVGAKMSLDTKTNFEITPE